MENATKALIIAGSVLIVIVLISVGVSILSSTRGLENNTKETADVMETNSFNSRFNGYVGPNMSGSQIRSLCSTAIASNAKNTAHQVSLSLTDGASGSDSTSISTIASSVSANARYGVVPAYDAAGYIITLTISPAGT